MLGCRRASSWPRLPTSDAQAKALFARHQRRFRSEPIPKARALDRVFLWERLQQTPLSRWQVGWPEILRWLQAQLAADRAPQGLRWLLWGTFHDAGGQIDAFRRLLFHDGLQGLSLVALEALAADGRWRGIPRVSQRGREALLLVPDRHMGGHWSRARTRRSAPKQAASRPGSGSKDGPRSREGRVVVRSALPGQLQIASQRLSLTADRSVSAVVPAGCGPFVWRATGRALMMSGQLCVPAGGKVELSLEPKRRRARKVLWLPYRR